MAAEDRIEKAKKALEKVIRAATERYIDGDEKVAYERFADAADGGYYIFTVWPGDDLIHVNHVCRQLRFADMGFTFAGFSALVYSTDDIARLSLSAIDALEGRKE